MSRLPITVIVLVLLSLFATADLYLNKVELKTQANMPAIPTQQPVVQAPDNKLLLSGNYAGYQVAQQFETRQIFEKINLNEIKNIRIFKSQLIDDSEIPLFIYEVIGPDNQGQLTYLNVKLELIAQMNNSTETINETNSFGSNSFFFNDTDYPNTAFLLTQIDDHLYGFQYSKEKPETYGKVQAVIKELSTKI